VDARDYSKEFLEELTEYFAVASEHPRPDKWLPIMIQREYTVLDCRRKMPIALINRYVPLSGARVLDAGCGAGRNSVLLSERGAQVTGLDIDPKALKVAASRCREHGVAVELVKGSVVKMPFLEGSFDAVVFQNVLEHTTRSDQPQALREMMRVLRKGGVLFIQTPNKLSPFDIHSTRMPLLHWLPRRISHLVERLGVQPPNEDLVSYTSIVNALKSMGPFEVLNHCDAWENLSDYRQNWTNYSNAFGFAARLYFRLVPVAYIISRVFRFELNKWLPNLNLFVRKG